MEELLAQPLIVVAKKYLGELGKSLGELGIDRYHHVLVLIADHHENLTQKALGELLHIDKSYMVGLLDYLEEHDYVLRERNPEDRREQLIRLTDKAKRDIPVIRKNLHKLNQAALKNIDPADIHVFHQVVKTITLNLSKGASQEPAS